MAEAPHFLVTAGGTLENIDRVRVWGNIFTGATGYAIARALADVGPVELLTSNRAHIAAVQAGRLPQKPRHPLTAAGYASHEQLKALLAARMRERRIAGVFMSAAVSDYKPVQTFEVVERKVHPDGDEVWHVRSAQAGKVKSYYDHIAVLGERTEKLVDLFRGIWQFHGLLVKFKLEVGVGADELIRIGQDSRRTSGAEYLVANTLEMIEGPQAGAFLLSDAGHEFIPREQIGPRLARLAREHFKLP